MVIAGDARTENAAQVAGDSHPRVSAIDLLIRGPAPAENVAIFRQFWPDLREGPGSSLTSRVGPRYKSNIDTDKLLTFLPRQSPDPV